MKYYKAKKTKKAKKGKALKLAKQKPMMLETPQGADDDLRMILNKADFDKYELDTYLNDFR